MLRGAAALTINSRKVPEAPVGSHSGGYDWQAARGRFLALGSAVTGVHETIFAKQNDSAGSPACGQPCVAHCIAGQPRELVPMPGLQKAIRYRLLERFSAKPVNFAVFAASSASGTPSVEEGAPGFVRTAVDAVSDEQLRPVLEFLNVDRALIMREDPGCEGGNCREKNALECQAQDLNITNQFDKSTGRYSGRPCVIQMMRLSTCLGMIQNYEGDHDMRFDWVTRVRPDVYFTRPIVPVSQLATDAVHFTPWASCGFGGMDWFYAMPRSMVDKVAGFGQGVSCGVYSDPSKHKEDLRQACTECLGCECWLAAWLFAEGLNFQRLPWGWHMPKKFCGMDDCPSDWHVTESNIGCWEHDQRCRSQPCYVMNGTNWCP